MPKRESEPSGPAVAEPPVIPAAPKIKIVPKEEQQTRLTPRYKVLIHNDDITPMDFVVHVLQEIFKKSSFEAAEIMLKAHFSGVALVTVLPLEEAELRIEQAHALARPRTYPLTFTCEPE